MTADAATARPSPGPDLFRLDGRVALVTGAGGELASAAALGFARAGASLVVTDRDADRLAATAAGIEALGAACLAVPSDSTDQASIDRVFEALDQRFGRLDVLLNAAGINPMQGRPEDFPMEIWALVVDVNLTGYLRFAKAAGRRMIDGGRGGSIINISSIAGTSALGRGNLAYGVSKAGVDQMTRELAVDWAWRGIRVNSIQPCQFLNDGLRALIADPERAHLADRMIAGIPTGGWGGPTRSSAPSCSSPRTPRPWSRASTCRWTAGTGRSTREARCRTDDRRAHARPRARTPTRTDARTRTRESRMTDHTPALVLRADDIEPFTHPDDGDYHSQHVLGRETTGLHDLLLNRGTLDAHAGLSGGNHPDNDEVYYIVRGSAVVDLGGEPKTGAGHETFWVEPDMVVFIPAGTFHRLRNDSDEPLVILTFWPQPAAAGANGIHDRRLAEWGTGFRLRDGCDLRQDGAITRVVAADPGWDPRVAESSEPVERRSPDEEVRDGHD